MQHEEIHDASRVYVYEMPERHMLEIWRWQP